MIMKFFCVGTTVATTVGLMFFFIALPEMNNFRGTFSSDLIAKYPTFAEMRTLQANFIGNQSSPQLSEIYRVLEANNMKDRWEDKMVIQIVKHRYFSQCDQDAPYVEKSCKSYPERVCIFTCDSQYYNVSDIVVHDIFFSKGFPLWRPAGQKWVAMDYEPPPHGRMIWYRIPHLNDVKTTFNISSFYAGGSKIPNNLDSKIPWFIQWPKYNEIKEKKIDFTVNKTGVAAWMVSHCYQVQSERNSFIQELRKYIQVDIYGKCGKRIPTGPYNRMRDSEVALLKKYHFYLAFENSFCENYVTEKIFKVFGDSLPILPVVMGKINYSQILPQDTYIDVKSFSSPKELAMRMKEVMANKDTYNEIVARKMATDYTPPESFNCRMCDYVHENRNRKETIGDITTFWTPERFCQDPREYMPGDFWDVYKNVPIKVDDHTKKQ